jgi:hypothetical protein
LPVTPGPAVTAPVTGGQICAQAPLHFEVVAVSGANEYRVKPLALVTTVTPLTCAVFSAPLAAAALVAEAGALDAEAGALEGAAPALPLDDELEHAAALIATAAVPAAASIVIRIPMDISLLITACFAMDRLKRADCRARPPDAPLSGGCAPRGGNVRLGPLNRAAQPKLPAEPPSVTAPDGVARGAVRHAHGHAGRQSSVHGPGRRSSRLPRLPWPVPVVSGFTTT